MPRKKRGEESRHVKNSQTHHEAEQFREKRVKTGYPGQAVMGEVERGRDEESMSCPTRAGYIFYTSKGWT